MAFLFRRLTDSLFLWRCLRPRRHSIIGVLLIAMAVAFLLTCRKGTPTTLRIAMSSEPVTFDPHLQDEKTTMSILGNLYEGLTAFDPDMRIEPALASSWENPDELRWRFHLRQGVRFHDGRKLSTDDVAFSIQRARRHPKSMVSGFMVAVRNTQIIDETTIDIITDKPFPLLLRKLGFIAIVPSDSPDEIQIPIGTGPYAFKSYTKGKELNLAAMKGYWRGTPTWPHMRFVFAGEATRRVQLLLDGSVDVAASLTGEVLPRDSRASECMLRMRSGLAVTFLGLRVNAPPLSDPRVRQAINLALDRRRLVRMGLADQAEPASQLVNPQIFGYVPSLSGTVQNLPEARRLLKEAGFSDGMDLDLECADGMERESVEIRSQLADVGIRVKLVTLTWKEMYGRLAEGRVGFFLAGYACDSGDASDLYDATMHTRDTGKGYGESNFMGYSNPALDRLIEEANQTMDMLMRRDLLEQATKIAAADLPLIPLWSNRTVYGLRAGINWQPRLDRKILGFEFHRREDG